MSSHQPVVFFDDVSRASKFVFLPKDQISSKHIVIQLDKCPNFPTCLDPKCFYEHDFDEEGNRQSKQAAAEEAATAAASAATNLRDKNTDTPYTSSNNSTNSTSASSVNDRERNSSSSSVAPSSTSSSTGQGSDRGGDNAWEWAKKHEPKLVGFYLMKRYNLFKPDIYRWMQVSNNRLS